VPESAVLMALGMLTLASLATIQWLAHRRANGPLLSYAARRPVPWIGPIVALAMAPAAMTVASNVSGMLAAAQATSESAPANPIELRDLWLVGLTFILLAGLCYACLAALFHADAHDLGLPTSGAELRRDAKLGAIAYLASLFPVYAIQLTLVTALENTDRHPIVVQLEADRSLGMMLAAALGAVVGAPLFEETSFRLVLQGWLEKFDPRNGEVLTPTAVDLAADNSTDPNAEVGEGAGEVEASAEPSLPLIAAPPDRPSFWPAILASSAAFSVAHVGQGVAPFSLFPLAVVLGYLNHRTHRIVPSIVCHALFNATTLLAMWLSPTSPPAGP
jgi:membrane protease YdiL (CAAX protease family)